MLTSCTVSLPVKSLPVLQGLATTHPWMTFLSTHLDVTSFPTLTLKLLRELCPSVNLLIYCTRIIITVSNLMAGAIFPHYHNLWKFTTDLFDK